METPAALDFRRRRPRLPLLLLLLLSGMMTEYRAAVADTGGEGMHPRHRQPEAFSGSKCIKKRLVRVEGTYITPRPFGWI